jgi:DNA-binding HxlR family transcriptional regulator
MSDPALRDAAATAGDRWVLLTTAALADGPRRFGDLLADVEGIAPNMLTDRLRRMERQGLLTAAPYSQRPRRYVYELTESGRELAALLPGLAAWAARRSGADTVPGSTSTARIRRPIPGCAGSEISPALISTQRNQPQVIPPEAPE